MAFEKYSDASLKKMQRILIVIAIVMLFVMGFALGYGIYKSANDIESNLLFLIPTVFGPLTFIPIIISNMVGAELKKRSN